MGRSLPTLVAGLIGRKQSPNSIQNCTNTWWQSSGMSRPSNRQTAGRLQLSPRLAGLLYIDAAIQIVTGLPTLNTS